MPDFLKPFQLHKVAGSRSPVKVGEVPSVYPNAEVLQISPDAGVEEVRLSYRCKETHLISLAGHQGQKSLQKASSKVGDFRTSEMRDRLDS